MKKRDDRREGKVSSACCAMEISEFLEVVERCKRLPEYHLGRPMGVAYFFFQLHMIAENFKCKYLTANMEFPYKLKYKMR